jgi:arylsulfatase A-like enzyme
VSDVLLVVLDSVRAASTSLHGHHRETTPTLDALATRATVYADARAPGNWSLPAHASLLTGVDAHRHGLHAGTRRLRRGTTVFEALADAGYDTAVASENVYLTDHRSDLAGAFDAAIGIPDAADTPSIRGPDGGRLGLPAPDAEPYRGGDASRGPVGSWYVDALLAWLDRVDGPWAACLNLMDAHRPYEPRPEHDRFADSFARRLQAEELGVKWEWPFHGDERRPWQLAALESLYEGGIRQADAALGRLLDGLRTRDALEDTLLVVTADHGEGFGERPDVPGGPRGLAHGMGVHDTLLHVPLVVDPPGSAPRGRRVEGPATLTRFPAAVEAFVGAERDLGAWGDPVRRRDRGPNVRPGAPDPGVFRPADGPVLATGSAISDRMASSLDAHVPDTSPYEHRGFAVYRAADVRADGGEPVERAVDRRVAWGDAGRTWRVYDALTRRPVADADPDAVRAAFDGPGAAVDAPVADDGPDEAVVDRLRDLGYY